MPVEISLVSDKLKAVKEESDPFDASLQFVSPGDVITRFENSSYLNWEPTFEAPQLVLIGGKC